MIDYILLIKILLLSWVITRFKPLQIILELLPDLLILNMVKLLFSCGMCLSLWLTLLITHDIFTASLASFTFFWYDKIFGFYENKIRLN